MQSLVAVSTTSYTNACNRSSFRRNSNNNTIALQSLSSSCINGSPLCFWNSFKESQRIRSTRTFYSATKNNNQRGTFIQKQHQNRQNYRSQYWYHTSVAPLNCNVTESSESTDDS